MTEQIFKWLIALVVMVCIPWLLESCGSIRKTDYRRSEEYVKERVQKIYATIALFYNRLDSLRTTGEGEPTEWPDFDKLFCSADWNEKVAAVSSIDEKFHEGEEGFFSWSYWTCAQDFAFMYASDVEVIDKTGPQATVALTLHNGDTAVPVLLRMVYEQDDWLIDDITNNWNRHPAYPYYEWKTNMADYLAKHQQQG